jgi:rod shape-determining protein MreC
MGKSNKRGIILAAAVIGLLIFLHFLKITRPLELVVSRALNPVLGGFYAAGTSLRLAYGRPAVESELIENAEELSGRVNELIEENARLKIVDEENRILREHLNFLTAGKHNYLMSNVIARGDPADLTETVESVTIDKGSRDGLYPGLAVVSGEGVIVGKIAETKEAAAKVHLTNSGRCKLAAVLLDADKTAGIAEGDLGLTIRMNFIPQDIEVKTGDIVVTSGLEQAIPRGLVIGSVISVNKESNDLWQFAVLEPLLNPENLSIVAVLLP